MTLAFGIDPLGEPINPVTFPWPRLNNHKVTLSFRPATAADEQTLESLLPEGPITDPSQLPSSIPAYLISVVPELALDGQVVGQGNAMYLGEDLNFTYDISRAGGIGNQTYTYPVVAGSYLTVGVAGGSVSATTLYSVVAKLEQTQESLISNNTPLIETFSRENLLGDMFYAGTLSYFSQFIAFTHISSISQKAGYNLPLAYGTFGYEPYVQTLFAFPRAIEGGGVAINVRLSWATQSFDGNAARQRELNLNAGMLSSALEHGVPEKMFGTTQQPAQGVSTAKILQLAAQQGQRIYRITSVNQSQVLPNLHLDSLALSEISQVLATGKEVITHTDRISVPGWTGEGYVFFDPQTGDGAYKITGGNNGGFVDVENGINMVLESIANIWSRTGDALAKTL